MLSVRGSRELKAVVLALKAARRDVRNDINRATRAEMSPVWVDLVEKRAQSQVDRKVVAKGARILAGNPPVAVAANSRRPLRGGLVPVEQWHAIEFGADQGTKTTYERRSTRGKVHNVTRHTTRQLPARVAKGRIAYPALNEFAPRLASLWVSLVVRKFSEAVEKGE